MRALNQVPNIGAASGAFPDGVIVDEAGGVTGTALTEILYGDLIQLMHKIRRLAGVTPNNQPDNETNGYQLFDAMNRMFIPRWTASGQGVDFANVKFVQHGQGLYYHKTAVNTTNNPSIDTTNWALVAQWDGLKMVYADGLSSSLIYPTYENLVLRPGVSTVNLAGDTGWAYITKQGKLYTVEFYLKIDPGVVTMANSDTMPVDFNPSIKTALSGDIRIVNAGTMSDGTFFPFQIYQVAGSTKVAIVNQTTISSQKRVYGSASWYGA